MAAQQNQYVLNKLSGIVNVFKPQRINRLVSIKDQETLGDRLIATRLNQIVPHFYKFKMQKNINTKNLDRSDELIKTKLQDITNGKYNELRDIMQRYGFIIAGGFVTSLIFDTVCSDIDLFCVSNRQSLIDGSYELLKFFRAEGFQLYTNNTINIKATKDNISVDIVYSVNKSIVEVLGKFDLSCSMFAYNPADEKVYSNGLGVLTLRGFYANNMDERAHPIFPNLGVNNLRTPQRIVKYLLRGFVVPSFYKSLNYKYCGVVLHLDSYSKYISYVSCVSVTGATNNGIKNITDANLASINNDTAEKITLTSKIIPFGQKKGDKKMHTTSEMINIDAKDVYEIMFSNKFELGGHIVPANGEYTSMLSKNKESDTTNNATDTGSPNDTISDNDTASVGDVDSSSDSSSTTDVQNDNNTDATVSTNSTVNTDNATSVVSSSSTVNTDNTAPVVSTAPVDSTAPLGAFRANETDNKSTNQDKHDKLYNIDELVPDPVGEEVLDEVVPKQFENLTLN